MKASELLGRPVLDVHGNRLGMVHDARVLIPTPDNGGEPERPPPGIHSAPVLTSLVVGPDTLRCRLAHAWGYAQGDNERPALLRALVSGHASRTHVIPVDEVTNWDDDGHIRLSGGER